MEEWEGGRIFGLSRREWNELKKQQREYNKRNSDRIKKMEQEYLDILRKVQVDAVFKLKE